MKQIIVEIRDLSDSVEVYESKPSPLIMYTIYAILACILGAVIWASIFKLDDVVTGNGIFKGTNRIYDVSSGISGQVSDCKVQNGDYVNEGDILYIVKVDSLGDTILSYNKELENANARLEMLTAYEVALDKGEKISDKYAKNKYYDEFVNRYELLYAGIEQGTVKNTEMQDAYVENVDSIQSAINQYEDKINKLNQVKDCIVNRNNKFSDADNYYNSIVSSYLSSYNYNKLQYDNKINEYENQINKLDSQIKKASGEEAATLKKEKSETKNAKEATESERKQSLVNLEQNQIASIEQMIEGYNNNLISLETSLSSAKIQRDSSGAQKTEDNIAVLTEKGNIAAEKLTYEDKKAECENYLKSYNIQNDNCSISALTSGYYYSNSNVKNGTYIDAGKTIGSIYPEKESEFYAEVYVLNSDIGRIKEGMEVKFEIAAYPSNEYGYFTGSVESISRDISVDETTGNAYYVVKVKCDKTELKDKAGESVSLKNGMACSGKVVIGSKSVMTYVLEKLNIYG